MRKADYFIKALSGGAYRYKAWVLHCFSLAKLSESEPFPYRLSSEGSTYAFVDPETGETEALEDAPTNLPPFHFRETLELKTDDVPNLTKDITSNYGRLLANYIALVHPFGGKIAYQEGEFNIGAVEKEIAKRLTTDPEYQDKDSFKSDDPIYVSEYLVFADALLSMEGYSQLCVPAATAKSMTRDPNTAKLKKELLERYKDRLDDPAVIARIDAELIALDKAWIKGDLSEGFFRKGKSYDVVRKKMHLMHGYEGGFGLEPAVIENSLSEGWDIDQLPAMVNSLREGSYGRGKMTEKGGYATKVANRMFQNVNLKREDCGTTLGWERPVGPKHEGYYYITSNGRTARIDDPKAMRGQVVKMRSPQFCKARGVDFCRYCIGDANSENEKAISAHVSAMTSELMSIAMASAHGVALKTTVYDASFTIK